MKDLPPRVIATATTSTPSNLVGGMKDVGVLGMQNKVKNEPKKGVMDKQTSFKTDDGWNPDPNHKLIPPG